MQKNCRTAPNGPPALGPYSHSVAAGDFLFVSGQGPFSRDGAGAVKGSFESEARATLENLRTVLEDCGSSMKNVVKTTVFLTDMGRFKEFNAVYAEYFPEDPPARSCIQAAALPGGIQVEVEAIALLKKGE